MGRVPARAPSRDTLADVHGESRLRARLSQPRVPPLPRARGWSPREPSSWSPREPSSSPRATPPLFCDSASLPPPSLPPRSTLRDARGSPRRGARIRARVPRAPSSPSSQRGAWLDARRPPPRLSLPLGRGRWLPRLRARAPPSLSPSPPTATHFAPIRGPDVRGRLESSSRGFRGRRSASVPRGGPLTDALARHDRPRRAGPPR